MFIISKKSYNFATEIEIKSKPYCNVMLKQLQGNRFKRINPEEDSDRFRRESEEDSDKILEEDSDRFRRESEEDSDKILEEDSDRFERKFG